LAPGLTAIRGRTGEVLAREEDLCTWLGLKWVSELSRAAVGYCCCWLAMAVAIANPSDRVYIAEWFSMHWAFTRIFFYLLDPMIGQTGCQGLLFTKIHEFQRRMINIVNSY
jgi:hypothetical protein